MCTRYTYSYAYTEVRIRVKFAALFHPRGGVDINALPCNSRTSLSGQTIYNIWMHQERFAVAWLLVLHYTFLFLFLMFLTMLWEAYKP